MFSRRSRLMRVSCVVNDLLATAVSFLLAYGMRVWVGQKHWLGLHGIYPFSAYLPVFVAIVLLIPLLGYLLNAYQQVELKRPRDIATDAVKMVALGLLALFTGMFFFQSQYVSRGLLLAFVLLQFVLLAGSRWTLLATGTWLRTRPENRRHFIIVGTSQSAAQLASLLEEGQNLGLELLAFAYTAREEPATPADLRRRYPLMPLDQLPQLLHSHVVDEVLFAVNREDLAGLEPLMQQCEQEGIHMRMHLDFLPQGFNHVFVEHLGQIPLLTFASSPQNDFALAFKRMVDMLVAVTALILLSPVFLLLAILIKLASRGPVFYRQTRCGLGGRRFRLLKFRSMVANADQLLPQLEKFNELDGPAFKMRNDPRCTRIGRWMRVLSLDELPQLWNVLLGHMSLVGPRPPLPEEVDQYHSWQRRRLRMRPGMTCLWALQGRSQLRFDNWVRLDLLYIDNWSVWLDFKILLKTIPAVLTGRGAH
ncbi:MAG TPA: sugar transferase [Terriglobales bacterium]|jgi:exopolysaccharide biosynthesis polyprenyl glycosylphosphotransferase|nr:sugar transferase [Terriglobales bacterium]